MDSIPVGYSTLATRPLLARISTMTPVTPDLQRRRISGALTPDGQPELLDHNARLYVTFATDRGPRLILERDLAPQDAPARDYFLALRPGNVAGVAPAVHGAPAGPGIQTQPWHPPTGTGWSQCPHRYISTLFNWVTSETQEIDAPPPVAFPPGNGDRGTRNCGSP